MHSASFLVLVLLCSCLLPDPGTGLSLILDAVYKNGQDGVSNLNGVYDLKLSADQSSVYVPCDESNATVVFSTNPNNGGLTYQESYFVPFHAFNAMISPDQRSVYVSGAIYNQKPDPGYIAAYNRHPNGSLELRQIINDGLPGYGIMLSQSPKGDLVYLGEDNMGIGVFSRDRNSGNLTSLRRYAAFASAYSVAASADGRNFYSVGGNTVLVYDAMTDPGHLLLRQRLTNGMNGITGLDGASFVLEAGTNVYVGCYAGNGGGSVLAFQRDQTTGTLTFLQSFLSSSIPGISRVAAMMLTPQILSRCFLFVAGANLVVFEIHPNEGGRLSYVTSNNKANNGIGLAMFTTHFTDQQWLYVASQDDYIALFQFFVVG